MINKVRVLAATLMIMAGASVMVAPVFASASTGPVHVAGTTWGSPVADGNHWHGPSAAAIHLAMSMPILGATQSTTVTDITSALGDQAGSVAGGVEGLVASNALGLGALLGGIMVILFLPSLIRRFFPKR